MSSYYLVLIETSGNQHYIFSTNRLRENMGASELTYQAGTFWVGSAVDNQNQQKKFQSRLTPEQFRKAVRSQVPLNQNGQKAEIIVAASGKALVLTRDEDTAKEIISDVTKKALITAPGLDVSGVYVKIEDWEKPNSLAEAIKKVHKVFEKARSRRSSPQNRFLGLPIVAKCASSELPAYNLEKLGKKQLEYGKKPKPISRASWVKREKAQDAKTRLTNLDERLQAQIDRILDEEKSDEEKLSWLAIVHADGNGLGQIFMNFEKYIGDDKSNRNYINHYREFSLALDECTEAAFKDKKAINVFLAKESENKDKFAPIVPLIIGGDDLTVVCDGQYALEFTRVFLQEFEKETEGKPEIAKIAKQAFGVPRLSACAGVAIVKRHFPFSVAYHLAEQLIKSAKSVKKKVTCKPSKTIPKNTPFPCSAIDFHILYDTSGVDLSDIREKLEPEPNIQLYNRPYIVSENLEEAENQGWIELHQWELLNSRVKELNGDQLQSSRIKESNGDQLDPLSSSQHHALRTALFIGKDAADSQYKLIQQRYTLTPFTESEDSVFHKAEDEGIYQTSFLDALDAKDFLRSDLSEQNKDQSEEG